MKTLCVRIQPGTRAKLDAIADSQGLRVTQLARMILTRLANHVATEPETGKVISFPVQSDLAGLLAAEPSAPREDEE